MKTNPAGISLIKLFEGLRLKAYFCPAGVLTIGYGHTGPDVEKGMEISEEKAAKLLCCDLEIFEEGVSHYLGNAGTTPNQFLRHGVAGLQHRPGRLQEIVGLAPAPRGQA